MAQSQTDATIATNLTQGLYRKALVIGASGGIGWELTKELFARGIDCLLVAKDETKLTLRENELCSLGQQNHAEIMPFVLEPSNINSFVTAVSERGPFDLYVQAFGPFLFKEFHLISQKELRYCIDLNLVLPSLMTHALLSPMLTKSWGRFIFFGGTKTCSLRPFKKSAVYASAKIGLASLSLSINASYREKGIRSLLICPGLVDTEYLTAEARRALQTMSRSGSLLSAATIAKDIVEEILRPFSDTSAAVIDYQNDLRQEYFPDADPLSLFIKK